MCWITIQSYNLDYSSKKHFEVCNISFYIPGSRVPVKIKHDHLVYEHDDNSCFTQLALP